MNILYYIIAPLLLCQSLIAQSTFRETVMLNREQILKYHTDALHGLSEESVIEVTKDPAAAKEVQIAAALILLKEYKSQKSKDAVWDALGLEMPSRLTEWEKATFWKHRFPVAAEVASRSDLRPKFLQLMLDGSLPDDVAWQVLLQYQKDKVEISEQLEELVKSPTTPEQRQRGERMLEILEKGVRKNPPGKTTAEGPAPETPLPQVQELPSEKGSETEPALPETTLGK